MDPEIVEYFDRRFDEAERRSQERFDAAERSNQERFAEVNQRFDESERRNQERFDAAERRNEERFAEVNQRFDESEGRNQERFAEVNQRFDESERRNEERFAEVNRRFDENERRFERVDHQIAEVKESVRHTNVIVEDLRSKVEIVAEGVMAVQERQDRDREELRGEIREVRTFVEVSYGALDRRLKVLEAN